MMDNNYILSAIRYYAQERQKEPRCNLPRGCFEQWSYQKWAVDELLKHIEKSVSMTPIAVIEDFIRRTKRYSHRKDKTGMIFSIAHDIAVDILDVLMAMQ